MLRAREDVEGGPRHAVDVEAVGAGECFGEVLGILRTSDPLLSRRSTQ